MNFMRKDWFSGAHAYAFGVQGFAFCVQGLVFWCACIRILCARIHASYCWAHGFAKFFQVL